MPGSPYLEDCRTKADVLVAGALSRCLDFSVSPVLSFPYFLNLSWGRECGGEGVGMDGYKLK